MKREERRREKRNKRGRMQTDGGRREKRGERRKETRWRMQSREGGRRETGKKMRGLRLKKKGDGRQEICRLKEVITACSIT